MVRTVTEKVALAVEVTVEKLLLFLLWPLLVIAIVMVTIVVIVVRVMKYHFYHVPCGSWFTSR